MERGEIYRVSLHPGSGHKQRGHRPVLIVSPRAFNALTKTPIVLPITRGANFAGFAVSLEEVGLVTTGIVRCDQPRALDLASRRGVLIERVLDAVMGEVLARVVTLFE